jgi:hypothetical protein
MKNLYQLTDVGQIRTANRAFKQLVDKEEGATK